MTNTIVFLHIPKTAGQTVHNALVPAVGGEGNVSPVRVHTQAPNGPQMPAGYNLYSGHIDWTELETLPEDRFVFTVLRDPRERVASFFLYLEKEAKNLSGKELALPHNIGKRRILEQSADEYFMGGDKPWQRFISDHYDNFYCTYFTTRMIRGSKLVENLTRSSLLTQAQAGLAKMDAVYSVDDLAQLETDIEARLGKRINVTETYHNIGAASRGEARWPRLMARIKSEEAQARLESFVEKDMLLMQQIGMAQGLFTPVRDLYQPSLTKTRWPQ